MYIQSTDHSFVARCRLMNARQFTERIGQDYAAKYGRRFEFEAAASFDTMRLRGKHVIIKHTSHILYQIYLIHVYVYTIYVIYTSVAQRRFVEGHES